MPNLPKMPFIYGRPVQGSEFLNRQPELRTILNRLRNGESTAIVGEPHIGKSSVLMHIADRQTCPEYLGSDADSLIISYRDLQPIKNDYTPCDFWAEMLEPLRKNPDDTSISQFLEQAFQSKFDRRPMEKLFDYLVSQKFRLVLLLDEYERLLMHPNFQEGSFYALIRSLASRNRGLVVVTASRLSLAEMNERSRTLLPGTSPLFNFMTEVQLRSFDDKTASLLLERTGSNISANDRRFICRMAGRHPFLLQAMAAAFLETKGGDRQGQAGEAFYVRASSHFDDLWYTLDDRSRTAAVILCLIEFGKRALGQKFACGDIENIPAFGPELRQLAERGLAEKADQGWQFDLKNLLLWRGERWTISSQAFAWWVRDVVIAEARPVQTYEKWLTDKCYTLLLTQQQWTWLTSTVRNAPDWALRGVAGLARAVFAEMTKKK